MDALAAVGLVGNILQFIDFSSKLIARANQLYNSNEGALLENIDIEKTTNDLSVLSNKLMNNLSVESTALQNLSLSCNAIAATLLEKLQKMKVKGQPTRWKSMRKVISTAWNEKELLELERRLSRYREELNLRIVVDLRDQLLEMRLEHSEAFRDSVSAARDILDALVDQQGAYYRKKSVNNVRATYSGSFISSPAIAQAQRGSTIIGGTVTFGTTYFGTVAGSAPAEPKESITGQSNL